MNMKSLIKKIECIMPIVVDKPLVVFQICNDGAMPSKMEEEIAIKKFKELNLHSPSIVLTFIPYGFEHSVKP